MNLDYQYTDEQLEKIKNQGLIYACVCPSQVSEQVLSLRLLLKYQAQCQEEVDDRTIDTHNLIVEASVKAHEIMEKCLHDILIREGWDLETLQMPEYLRDLIVEKLLG
ncbi:MAG: hypothetical protein NTY69_05305 [Methylococcales bacterium]|nr:hypothetical protein [Methylococcales bacterium]